MTIPDSVCKRGPPLLRFKMASLAEKLASTEDVEIDESGRFKYILIKVFAGSTSKFIVRGYDWAEYHDLMSQKIVGTIPLCFASLSSGTQKEGFCMKEANFDTCVKYVMQMMLPFLADIYDKVSSGLDALGLTSECVGGGRIQHNPNSKEILVYGYSMGFGRADHQVTVNLLKKRYTQYKSITFSNEGY